MKFVEGFLAGVVVGVLVAVLLPVNGAEACPRPGDGRRDGTCFVAIE